MGDLLRDLLAGRELAWRLFVRDLTSQYRSTYLGYIWAILPPLMGAVTFIFMQSQGITNIRDTGIPYPAFVMIGTLLWQTFVDAIQSPLVALSSAKPMLSKINFPREAILVAGLYMVSFNLLIRFVIILLIMLFWKITPGITLAIFPLMMLGLMLCGFAIGLMLTPMGSLYGDISKGIPIVAQFWMLLTPVVYPARTTGLGGWLTIWNPISPIIVTARASLTNQPLEQILPSLVILGAAAMIATLGLIVFRLTIPHLIARMGG
jgi:lipopolysaccharide transport system permease protein